MKKKKKTNKKKRKEEVVSKEEVCTRCNVYRCQRNWQAEFKLKSRLIYSFCIHVLGEGMNLSLHSQSRVGSLMYFIIFFTKPTIAMQNLQILLKKETVINNNREKPRKRV